MLCSFHVIFALLHLQTVLARFGFAQNQKRLRIRYIYDIGIRTIYNSPADHDNEGEKVENKTGANIFLYTINASYFLHFLFTERIGAREKGRSEKQESPY